MKLKMLLFLALLSSLTSAFATDLLEGTFQGETVDGKKDVELFLQEYPGREGSFLAILIRDKTQGFAYLVDKFSESKYGMTPLKALSNAVIGMDNSNPSLSLTIVKEKNRDFIRILNNNSDNTLGLSDGMKIRFVDNSNVSRLVKSLSGTFKYNDNRTSATLSEQNAAGEASLTLTISALPGEYVLREVRPSLHLLLKSSLSYTGTEIDDRSDKMAFFLKGKHLFGPGSYMVLMESNTGKLTYLKQI